MASATDSPPGDAQAPAPGQPLAPGKHGCPHCGAPLSPGQEWCTSCGAVTAGALGASRGRSTGALAAGVALLAIGAAAAAIAASKQHSPARSTVVKVAQLPPSATTPSATPAKSTVPSTNSGHPKLPLPIQKSKLPKIPLTAITPSKSSPPASSKNSAGEDNGGSAPSSGKSSSGAEGTHSGGSESSSEPAAILLDTDAASTYNPYGLPASDFGDPSLTIDGDTQTAWTAQVEPARAPAMAEGVLLSLGQATKVSALVLDTSTPGMTVQVWATAEHKPPESILDKGWVPLSGPRVVKKRSTRIKLHAQKKGALYVLLWISKAPADQLGTPQAPGHVAIGELELFPAS